jgi:hypothetical protein
MSRRKFLRDGLGLLLAIPAVWAQSILKQPSLSSEVQAICSLSPSNESAVRLGKKYLLQHPEHCNSQLLAELIFSGWSESKRQLALSEPSILKEMLTSQIRLDFRLHNVSSLGGWMLSNTELQQWALLSLVAL